MNSYLIVRRNAWQTAAELERAAGRASRVANEEMPEQVRWVRSYIREETDGSLASVCIFQAVNAEAAREHARRANIACDAVLPIARAVLINDDPTL